MARRTSRAPWATVALVALGAVVAAFPCAAASASEPARFVWSAPASCPSRGALLERIRSVAREVERPSGIAAEVRVWQTADDHWSAHVALVDDGTLSERSLDATSCDAIADAVILIVGLSAVPTPASAVSVAPPHRPVAPSRPAPPAGRPAFYGLAAHADLTLDEGSLPAVAPGLSLGVTWRAPHVAFGIAGAAFVDQRGFVQGSRVEGALMGLARGSVDVCLSVPLGDRLVIDACAGLAMERVTAAGFGPPQAFRAATPIPVVTQASALGELGAEWWPVGRIGIRAAACGLAPIGQRTFFVKGGGDVFRPSRLAVEPYMGLVVLLAK